MKFKIYTKARKWLNPILAYNSGAIQYKVSADKPWKEGEVDIFAELSIWDCSRKIVLDFNVSDEESAKNVAKKIKIIQDALQDMKESLGRAYNDSINAEVREEE